MTRLLIAHPITETSEIRVEGDEWFYLTRVRRHTEGDRIVLRDSSGNRFAAVVAEIGRDFALVRVEQQLPAAPDGWPVHLLVAVPKGTLFDEVVRRMTEIGVARLTPLICDRSVVIPGDGRESRWHRISEESTRQCGRAIPMRVDPATPFRQAIAAAEGDLRLMLHPSAEGVGALSLCRERLPESIVAAIGPEGGFTDAEAAVAVAAGFQAVRAGESVLRVETAAVVAAALFVSFVGGLD